MKRMPTTILTLAMVGMFLISPVAAATSQGLEWGITTGFHAEYTLTATKDTTLGVPDLNEGMYLNVTGMPSAAIPDPLDDWNNIPTGFTDQFYWDNDTSIGLWGFIFLGLTAVGYRFFLPTGNWDLLKTLLASELTGEEITSDVSEWQVVWSQDQSPTEQLRITAAYSKDDGALSDYSIEVVSTLNSSVLGQLQVERNTEPGGSEIIQFLMDNILYVGIGVGIIVIIGVLVLSRRK